MFRSIEEHYSFPYLFGLKETNKQEWTNLIALWHTTVVKMARLWEGVRISGLAAVGGIVLDTAGSRQLHSRTIASQGWVHHPSFWHRQIPRGTEAHGWAHQNTWRECRLCRTHTEAWEKSGMEAAAEWNYSVLITHCLAGGTECNLWWDQVPEGRCLWQKSEAETMNGEERYTEISWAC